MSNNKTNTLKSPWLWDRWKKLSITMRAGIVSGCILGCFTVGAAFISIVGVIINTLLNFSLDNPPSNIYFHQITINHIKDYYEGIGCIHNIWAISKDNPQSILIEEGEVYSKESMDEIALVAPIYTYITLETELPSNDFITIENIDILIDQFSGPEDQAVIVVPSSICAGSDPGFPNLDGVFPVRITPDTRQMSITEPRETKPSLVNFTVNNDSPLLLKVFINSIDPGWYTLSIEVEFFYHGRKDHVVLDKSINIYVPVDNYVSDIYIADWNENNILNLLDDTSKDDLIREIQNLRENWIIMTLETPINNPDITGEYIRIENLGLEQDMTGWIIDGRDLISDRSIIPPFTFPQFLLGEWGSVRLWSGSGNNGPLDLYWHLNQDLLSNRSDFINIVLVNKSGDIISTLSYNPP